jgi:hypothetical protein
MQLVPLRCGVSALVSRETAEAAAAAPEGAKLPGTTVPNAQGLYAGSLGKPGMYGTMGPPREPGVHPRWSSAR